MKPHLIKYYSTKVGQDFMPSSKVKIFRKAPATTKNDKNERVQKQKVVPDEHKRESTSSCPPTASSTQCDYILNSVKIQMISQNLHKQIFGNSQRKSGTEEEAAIALKYVHDLRRHGINIDSTEQIEDVSLKLPPLKGKNIEEHFHAIAKDQVKPYEDLLNPLVGCKLPEKPENWMFQEGWTMYDTQTGESKAVPYPDEDALVLDVEVCVAEGGAPTLATAVGIKHWYSWCSPKLVNGGVESPHGQGPIREYSLFDLIPLGVKAPKVVIGHNVSYDRARLREQYLLEDTGVRFVDTMSLHVCVSGVTSYQRALLKSNKGEEVSPEDSEWISQSSLNSLPEVYRLYCGNGNDSLLSKEARNIFVEGDLQEVRSQFQYLMNYCAQDVCATHKVLSKLYPLFAERFPHPATLAGMLEMGSAYLPVNSNWLRYINESDLAYEDLSIEAKYHLSRRANEACGLMREEKYRQDLWLWDEDWSIQELKMKQTKNLKKSKVQLPKTSIQEQKKEDMSTEEHRLERKFQYLYETKEQLPARRPLLPGYPAWYRKLCVKPPKIGQEGDAEWSPGPTEISTGMQIAPKLLSLCWEGFPLHYLRDFGWGFLVPFRSDPAEENGRIPISQLVERCPVPEFAKRRQEASKAESAFALDTLSKELDAKLGKREFYAKVKKDHTAGQYQGSGVWCNKILENCCYFLKLPHKNGASQRVGNPLSRDFLNKFSENVLSSGGESGSSSAARVIEIARMMSYWRNNRDRIIGQMVVWLDNTSLPDRVKSLENPAWRYGAICPQVVACGTLTRRAMEPTWMTASNSQRERIGSELRAMVQAPKSYKIIGADVDSQELWIASVLGDAYACGIHGATPLGWMTLSGTKSRGTDMHSVTAKAVGISRDHAKVINYARIYGAGQNFAETLLKQFNPTFSATEARSKAMKMFAITKGKRVYKLKEEFLDEYEDRNYSAYEATKMAVNCNRPLAELFHKPSWIGGTESAMFNRLEDIALGDQPVTPFLGCRLSRALESNTGNENRFLPTRVNWVVQSGAVDFLHLMLVTMRWLMGSHVRFCLSFHDELRYLVKEEMAYKAALAMHITNLLTRSFCSARIGLNDLPMSVAFFSSVEVDTALRKESTMDCKTPSNPHGLQIGYGIPPGESLNVYKAIERAGGGDLTQWGWIK